MTRRSGQKKSSYSWPARAGFICGLIFYALFLFSQPARLQLPLAVKGQMASQQLPSAAVAGPAASGRQPLLQHPAYPLQQQAQKDSRRENLLVLYQADQGQLAAALLCTFDRQHDCLKVTSIQVDCPFTDQDAAKALSLADLYTSGGIGLLLNTLNQQLELDLQKFILVEQKALAALIDAAGGLQLAEPAVDQATWQELPAEQSLPGRQALLLAQEAGLHEELLCAVLAKTAGWQLPLFLHLAAERQLDFVSNLSWSDPFRLGFFCLAQGRQIIFYQLPSTESVQPGQELAWPRQRQDLAEFIASGRQGD